MMDGMLTSETVRNFAIAASSAIAATAFVFSEVERRRNFGLQRYSAFIELEKRFHSNPVFQKIVRYIDDEEVDLSDVSTTEKFSYLSFLEEVELAIRSNLVKEITAFDWFGYYALRTSEDDAFISEVNRETPYWSLYFSFIDRMKKIESYALSPRGRKKLKKVKA